MKYLMRRQQSIEHHDEHRHSEADMRRFTRCICDWRHFSVVNSHEIPARQIIAENENANIGNAIYRLVIKNISRAYRY